MGYNDFVVIAFIDSLINNWLQSYKKLKEEGEGRDILINDKLRKEIIRITDYLTWVNCHYDLELTYSEPYHTNNLTIYHNSYQLTSNSENNQVTIDHDSNPKIIIFSTDDKDEITLLGGAELESINDLKLIIYKQGSSYLYYINNMKHKTVIQD